MRKRVSLFLFLIFLSIAVNIAAKEAEIPHYQGYVNDFARVISAADAAAIEKLAKELEDKTSAQIAVVTIKSIRPETIENYAVKLFKKWGIGRKGKDNGVLLLVAVEDREVRIETGYGLEGAIPDALARRIIENNIIPYFKQGQYSAGILSGNLEILKLIAREYKAEITGLQQFQNTRTAVPQTPAYRIIVVIILVIFMLSSFWPILWMLFTGEVPRNRGSWHYGGRGFGGGFGGGGFGGFGGGMSGGGGATGRW